MSSLDVVLILATLLCALVAGFAFAFATVVMPGIGKLADRDFIRAFQVIDGVIQAGQPVFGLIWLGSSVALVISAVMGVVQLAGMERALVVLSALAYGFGVQVPTFRINVPLNNRLQSLDIDAMDAGALSAARCDFEKRWNRWNAIRTAVATMVSGALMLVLLWL